MRRAAFVYEDALSQHVLRHDHPMRPVRLSHTYELLNAYGAFDNKASLLVKPRLATEQEVGWLHTPDYVSAVRGLSLSLSGYNPQRFGFSAQGDNPSIQACMRQHC
jgi:acetoin utilization deacetylase AcuC-like enzyme